jgi:hypothetical protein
VEELIFFAVLIFFSIIESIARSRKQSKGGGTLPELPEDVAREMETQWEAEQGEQAGHRPRGRPRPATSEVPTYDDDVSFDARTAGEEEGRSFDARPSEDEPTFDEVASTETERNKRAASSESMIPADIWEEIAGLAREAKVELPAPRPKPRPRLPPLQKKPRLPQERPEVPGPARPAPRPSPVRSRPSAPSPTMEGTAGHAVHLSHAGYGSDPSERQRSAEDGLDPLARTLGADAAAVRLQLRGQGAHGLRQAMILQEVLGPPVGSRPD